MNFLQARHKLKATITLLLFSFVANANSQSEIKEAEDKISYSIAISDFSYPFHFVENNQPSGAMVDVWRLWAKKQNVKVEFKVTDFEEGLQAVADGDIDIHAGFTQTAERGKHLAFSQQIMRSKNYLYLSMLLNNITTMKQVTPFTIGVLKGSLEQTLLSSKNNQFNLKTFTNRNAMYEAALNHKILIYADDNEGNKGYKEYETLRKEYPFSKRFKFFENPVVAGVSKTNTELLSFVNEGLSKISDHEYQTLLTAWRKYGINKDAISVAYPTDRPPYSVMDRTGKARGMFIDIWKLWAQEANKVIEFIPINRVDSYPVIESGLVDVHIGIPVAKQHPLYNENNWLIHSTFAQVYLSNAKRSINSMTELSGKAVGIFKFSPYLDEIQNQYEDVKFIKFNSVKAMIEAERSGKITSFIAAQESVEAEIHNMNLTGIYKRLITPRYQVDFSVVTNPDNQLLQQLVLKGAAQLGKNEIASIKATWLKAVEQETSVISHYLADLTPEEANFLSRKNEFTVGVLNNYKPVEFTGKNGEVKGINRDILDVISEHTGVKFTYVNYDDWSDLFHDFLNQKYDIALGITPSEERRDKMHFSKRYYSTPWGVIGQPEFQDKVYSLDSLEGLTVAIIQDYISIEFIKDNYPLIKLRLVEDVNEGAELVNNGEVDAYIDFFPILTNMILDYDIDTFNIEYLNDLPPEENHMAINYDYPELAGILNKGINTISESDYENIRDYWLRTIIAEGYDKNMVIRTSLQVGVIILFIVGSVLWWSYRMRTEITKRRELEKELRFLACHDGLTSLANRRLFEEHLHSSIKLHKRRKESLAILFIDIDGFKAVNDSYGHAVGDELLVKISNLMLGSVRDSDIVSRFGGDEFIVLLNQVSSVGAANNVAKKLIEILSSPIDLSDCQVNIGASVGISFYPTDESNVEKLISLADTRMYQVKTQGKNNYLSTTVDEVQ
ncbi:transporter substrate-binding domain-containing protein [Thalassotalea nanhaiensis]|uniref:Transporter substrate-binding domain-containing protein n=1 Tax=Thalassotalea nanhaiensis TaxID=3065648 RepID=A0ABY9TE19_9GAMM|nr:transporter substrate-binding domain-containing protein [Colwelliaceae bacterium SQ345]